MKTRITKLHKIILIGLTVALLAVGLFSFSDQAYAGGFIDEKMDPALTAELANSSPLDLLEVVIVFDDLSVVPQVQLLAADFLQMSQLPMAGAILTAGQVETIANWPEVYSITLNQDLDYFLAESIPYIGADVVWDTYGQRGGNPDVTVAVVDSGIDGLHPDLPYGDKVIANIKMTPLGVGVEMPQTDTTSGHGTHVASTIGGTGAFSGGYYKGVAPEVGLIGLGSGEAISILTAVQSYDWVLANHADYNIRVVSNSWGSSGGDLNVRNPVTIATYEAYKLGILSVFAAGNDGGYDIMNPYSIAPWVLAVAAGDKQGNLAGFSSRGVDGDYYKHPDITAPGVDIYAARSATIGITALDAAPNPVNPLWTAHYTMMSGTSMATPHVSGAAALLFSENPQLSPDQVMDLLMNTTTPMPDYELFEVGLGYMNVLAAFEASLNETGNLDAFLAGDQIYGMNEVMGVDTDSLQYDTVTYRGYSAAAVSNMPANEYPIPVDENTVYVNAVVSWTPAEQDAFDLELLDPNGNVVSSSGNSVGEAESILFMPEMTGTYTLRLVPFVAVNAEYTAVVTTAYGDEIPNWPPHSEPAYDYYMNVTSVYKSTIVAGLVADYFQGGDSGFIVFTMLPSGDAPATGLAGDLQAIYTDSQGNVFIDDAVSERSTAGEYQSDFSLDSSWALAPGPIEVFFNYSGSALTREAKPVTFYYNYLEVGLNTDAVDYYPGDTINFDGAVSQWHTIGASNIETTPVDALVSVTLRDSDGNALATELVSANWQGNFSGSIVSPTSTRGTTTLVAEATYQDPFTLTGPASFYGSNSATLIFPGNLAPELSLYASSSTGKQNKYYAHIHATITDPDGLNDVTTMMVLITDADGRNIRRFKTDHFTPVGDTWMLTQSVRLHGVAPWTVTLTAVDSAGNTAAAASQITLNN